MSWFAIFAGFFALGLVLFIQRNAGHRTAGICVCLPLTSGPLALALYIASGADVAHVAVVGSIEAIGGSTVAITVFGLLRSWPLAVSVPITLLVFVAVVVVKDVLVTNVVQAVMVTSLLIALCAAFARSYLHEPATPRAAQPRDWRIDCLAPFLVLALVLLLSTLLSARWSGLLATAPVLALSVLIPMRVGNASARGITHVVLGSYCGMAAKLLFFIALLACLDFEKYGWMAFGFGAVACFASGAALWRRKLARPTPLSAAYAE